MYSHIDVIDEPISFSDEIWKFFTVSEADEPFVEADVEPFDEISRKDGEIFSEEDEDALLPYAGLIPLATLIYELLEVNDEASLNNQEFFGDVSRVDGSPMTDEDEAALLEFGAMAKLLTVAMGSEHPFAGPVEDEIETPPTASLADGLSRTPVASHKRPFPFAVERADGDAMDSDDEAALVEFAPLVVSTFYVGKVKEFLFGEAAGCQSLGLFSDADESLTAFGEELCAATGRANSARKEKRAVADFPGPEEDTANEEAADVTVGHWFDLDVGKLLVAVVTKTFGFSLQDSLASGKAGNNGLKRKPSGAELSAWIGRVTHSGLGLDDPSRKVRTRNLM